MPLRARRILPLAALCALSAAGCFRLPARVCLTPPYDAPAGFSETYHAALARREPLLQPGDEPVATGVPAGFSIGSPYGVPMGMMPAEPPIEW